MSAADDAAPPPGAEPPAGAIPPAGDAPGPAPASPAPAGPAPAGDAFRPASGEDVIGTVRLGAGTTAAAQASAAAPAPAAAAAPADLAVRLAALLYLLPSLGLLWFLTRHALRSDLGTESAGLRALVRALAVVVPGYPAALAAYALAVGRRPPRAWNLLALPFEGWWFSGLATLAWREVRAFFYRPVGYFVLFVWMLTNGVFFVILLNYYGGPDTLGQDFQQPPTVYVTGNWASFFVLVICCPALTMRLLADEQGRGTLEALLTAPVTPAQVVLSKFLGVSAFYLAMLAGIGVFMAIIRGYAAEWDWGPVVGGFLGLLLVGLFFFSIGLFASSLTDNQVVAFLAGVLPNLLMFPFLILLDNVTAQPWRALLDGVHIWQMHQEMIRGVLQLKTLVFFGTTTTLFLFLAVRGVESHRWR